MRMIKINCPECNLTIEYWTRNNSIICTGCNNGIIVELCLKPLDTEVEEDTEISE